MAKKVKVMDKRKIRGIRRRWLINSVGVVLLVLVLALLLFPLSVQAQEVDEEGFTQQLLEGLTARRFDLVFCSQPPARLQLTAVPVSRQDLVLIVPRAHPLAALHAVDLAETLSYPQVYFSPGSGMRDVVDGLFAQIGGSPQIAYETEEDQVIAGLVAQGFGIAVVPYMEMLLRLDVKILQISHPVWERNFYLVSDDSSYMPPAVRQFRQFVLNGGYL